MSQWVLICAAVCATVLLGCSESSSEGAGGVGGTGGSAGAGGANLCPLLHCNDGSECTEDFCDPADPHLCVFVNKPANAPCGYEGGVCDGEGACLRCPYPNDCSTSQYDPVAPGSCVAVNKPRGSLCGGGTGYCDGAGSCEYCDDANDCTDDRYGIETEMCSFANRPQSFPCDCGDGPCKLCDGFGNCICTADEQCVAECMPGQGCVLDTGVCEGGEAAPRHTPCRGDWSCDGVGNCVECTTDAQCEDDYDDYNDCTIDRCDLKTETCNANLPIADGTPCAGGSCYDGRCALTSLVLPCTEQGVRNAISAGGGPYTFDCDGPQTVVTKADIDIDKTVILDGEGKLTLDGDLDHRVFFVRDGEVELRNLTVVRGVGQGIYNVTTLTLTNFTASHNEGVGIENDGHLTMENTSATENTGRGVFSGYWVTIRNSTISGNEGHGIHKNMGLLVLVNSTVSGNEGNGVFCQGRFTILNSTISANDGDGIALDGSTTTNYLHNSTVSGNQGRAVVMDSGGSATIANNLIDGACVVQNVVISEGHNIESPGDSCSFNESTDLTNVDPEELKLEPLADNGGPTLTHALLPGSIALDRIPEAMCVGAYNDPIGEDQRGVTRPQGDACDVGAFELAQP